MTNQTFYKILLRSCYASVGIILFFYSLNKKLNGSIWQGMTVSKSALTVEYCELNQVDKFFHQTMNTYSNIVYFFFGILILQIAFANYKNRGLDNLNRLQRFPMLSLAKGNDGFNVNRNNTSTDRTNTLKIDSILRIPILFTYSNADGFVNPVTMQGFSAYGRRFAAPWNFVIDSTDTHTDYSISFPVTIGPWLDGVVNRRMPRVIDTTKLSYNLIPILDTIGWLGDIYTKKIAKYRNFTAKVDSANWFPDSLSAAKWSSFAMVPPYKIPPQPIVAPSGIIANLTVFDPVNNDISTGGYWHINANFKESDQLLSTIKFFAVAPIPPSIQGTNWIGSMAVGSNVSDFTVDPIFSFKVTADATVYVALSDLVTPLPAWLSTWQLTNEDLLVCSSNLKLFQKYSLYSKRFAKNSVATMGGHGTNNTAMYMTFVKPDNATSSVETFENGGPSVFPNPATSEITISVKDNVSFSTEIINVLGAVVLRHQNQNTIDVSHFQNGVYFLRMKVGEDFYVQKFVKQ